MLILVDTAKFESHGDEKLSRNITSNSHWSIFLFLLWNTLINWNRHSIHGKAFHWLYPVDILVILPFGPNDNFLNCWGMQERSYVMVKSRVLFREFRGRMVCVFFLVVCLSFIFLFISLFSTIYFVHSCKSKKCVWGNVLCNHSFFFVLYYSPQICEMHSRKRKL